MAKRITSDPDVSGTIAKRGRKRASDAFSDASKVNGHKAQTILPALDHNGPKARDLLHYFNTCKGLKAKADEINAHYRNALKGAKEAGVEPAIIVAAMRWEKRDPEEARQYFKALKAMFDATGQEIQLDMFDASGVSRAAQIFDDGVKAGQRGVGSTEGPHDENTPNGQTWLSGWHEGQRPLREGFGAKAEVESAAA